MSIVCQYHGDFIVHSIEQFGFILEIIGARVQQIEFRSSEFSKFSWGNIPQTPYTHSGLI